MTAPVVLSVGQCRPDQAAISHYLTRQFAARVLTADLPEAALQVLRTEPVDLVLINRLLDADGSEGLKILEQIRNGSEQPGVPVMLVSNYAEWQQRAVELGALPGFGKAELNRPETRAKLGAVLTKA
jgi:CheY-like chemotaxis protein